MYTHTYMHAYICMYRIYIRAPAWAVACTAAPA